MKTFDPTEALRLLDEANAALAAYTLHTGGRWALSDLQLRDHIEGHEDDLIGTVDETFVALITSGEATPSPYGDGQWADAAYDGYRDEVQDAIDKAGLRWPTCDDCGNNLDPTTACTERDDATGWVGCNDCCEHENHKTKEDGK